MIDPKTGQLVAESVPDSVDNSDLLVGDGAGKWTTLHSQAPEAQVKAGTEVILGYETAYTNRGSYITSLGGFAGSSDQGDGSTAVGFKAGQTTQGGLSTAVGWEAGQTTQGTNAVAVGYAAGKTTQGNSTVAVGNSAGTSLQGNFAVAVGYSAGELGQDVHSVAIGDYAAQDNQGQKSVAIGRQAGELTQGIRSVAVGNDAGRTNQGTACVAIGDQSGENGQGDNSIAIGFRAGRNNQVSGSVCINAGTSALEATDAGTFINPIRSTGTAGKDFRTANYVCQNTVSKELLQGGLALKLYTGSLIHNQAQVILAASELQIHRVFKIFAFDPYNPGSWHLEATLWCDNSPNSSKVHKLVAVNMHIFVHSSTGNLEIQNKSATTNAFRVYIVPMHL